MTKEITRLTADKGAKYYDRLVIQGREDIIRGYLAVAEGLYHIQKKKWFSYLGFNKFDDYIDERLGFKRSKAYGLIQIYTKFVLDYRYPKERLTEIGWTKLYYLAAYANDDNHNKLIEKAENMSALELKNAIKPTKRNQGSRNNFGELINLDVLKFGPVNEAGVVFLFGHLCKRLRFTVEYITAPFPDCVAHQRQSTGKYKKRLIEFEYKSADFVTHGHDPKGCDLIICWEHNWKDCPIEVISLREQIKEFALDRKE